MKVRNHTLFVFLIVGIGAAAQPGYAARTAATSPKPIEPESMTRTARQLASTAGTLRVHPSNPRYFTDGSGKAIYLTGSHTWAILQDQGKANPPRAFDFAAYLDFLKAHNHNFTRMWTWENARWAPWTEQDVFFDPLPYQRTGPGDAIDGRPKFDLTKFNQAYFDRLRSRVIAARDRRIYVAIMLFQGWSVFDGTQADIPRLSGNPWPGHPFNVNNNINGINGDPNGDNQGLEVHTLQIPAITRSQEDYVRKVIDTLNDLDNVLYEIANEATCNSAEWQYHMVNFIKNYQRTKPKQHPVGMTAVYTPNVGSCDDVLVNSPADWISPGGVDYKITPPAATGAKVIVLDTDHIWGVGGDRTWVWKSFTRGLNPIYMDPIDFSQPTMIRPKNQDKDDMILSARSAMGRTLAYANKMNVAAMVPRGDLASTGYCLANPGREYLVYVPPRRRHSIPLIGSLFKSTVTVDLSAAVGKLTVEWFNPRTGTSTNGGTTTGKGLRSFTAPFGGDAVLHVTIAEKPDKER